MTHGDATSTYPWKYRRAVVFLTLAFCFGSLTYLLLFGNDSRLHDTMAWGSYGLAGSVIGCYVFGATWHDTSLMKQPRSRRRVDPRETEAGAEEDDSNG